MSRTVIHLNPRTVSRPSTRTFAPTGAKCPGCLKSVYAAEQALGPAATPYHKSCLRCTRCRKVLDQSNMLEHGYDPYCKPCHSKTFGTKGVGYGNAVVAEYSPRSPSCNHPTSPGTLPTTQLSSPPHLPFEEPACCSSPSIDVSGRAEEENLSVPFDPPSQPPPPPPPMEQEQEQDYETVSSELSSLHISIKRRPTPSSQEQPLEEEHSEGRGGQARGLASSPPLLWASQPKRNPLTPPPKPPKPAFPLPAARAASSSPYNPRTTTAFSLDGPQRCPACSQTVYHAEQVLAIGKKWHKRCLRCSSCAKALDSNLAERAGKPYCPKCYDQLFGAAANGFVLRAGFVAK